MMDVCSFLERVRGQRYRLSALEDELKQCRADAELISSPALSERVQSSNQKDMSDLFIAIEHYEQLVQQAIAESIMYRERALNMISYETDNVSYSVLLRWYILDQSWEEIIREMHYSKSVLSDRKNESLTYLSRVISPELLEVRT
jgi:hypothetical protein|nr:MAG TPA: Protein of unknown function (DUF1492) [Caudoviricetes sp.]